MSDQDAPASSPRRAGYVAIAGAPNVGKSTLLNRILDRPLAIATPKPQTTRTRLLGVETRGNIQIVFCDTPGLHKSEGLLHDRMNAQARAGVREADVVLWVIDGTRGIRTVDRIEAENLDPSRTVVVINKTDVTAKPKLLPIMEEVARLVPGADIFPLSAKTGDGVPQLFDLLASRLPQADFFFEPDQVTDQTERFLVAELVREQLFLQLERELPYRVAVVIDVFEDKKKHTSITATIFTDSESSKRIIVGKGGARIKAVGVAARKTIEELLDRPVFLELFVKVKPGWQDDPRFLEELGL
ncbi:MAG TPA: GTPase Era [Candidatus Limnocylindrales bacterium]|nr:GTPase Era [Candidatus Limnocylindrales bacterium]